MKTTTLKTLLAAVVCLFAGVTAQAQFTGTVNQVPRNDYAPEAASFAMSDVAGTLGTDATTLVAALDAWIAEGSTDPNMFFYAAPSAPDTWTDAYTTGGEKGFWLNDQAEITAYGDGSAYYANPVWDAEQGVFSINIGLMPDALKWGVYQQTLKFALQYGGKTATFTVDLIVTGPDMPDVPQPTTLVEKDLNVVGEAETTVEQYPRGGYDSDLVKLYVPDLLEKLGIASGDVLANVLADVLYATQYDAGDSINIGGLKKDELSNAPTANAPGFWLHAVQDEGGNETGECSSYNYNAEDKFFIESFTFDADTLFCYLGQYPGVLKAEEHWYTNLYIVWGDKAYRLRYNLSVLEREQGTGMANFNKVGQDAVTVTQEPRTAWGSVQIYPDMEAIAAALGCEVSAVGFYALDNSDNFGQNTANNGGFWFDEGGRVVSYTEGAFYIEPAVANDFTTLNVGQMINKYDVGDEFTASVYFMNGDNYYQYDVTLKVTEPEYIEHSFENVSTRAFALQALLDNQYTPLDLAKVDISEVEALIGTSTPVLYGYNREEVVEQRGKYSKEWSCDPNPGFWLTDKGEVSTWYDENARVGICWLSDGTLRFFQYPNRNSIGDVFKTQLYLVNEEANKMITLNISLTFVETLVEKDIVGTENIILPVSTNDFAIDIDLDKAAQALGVEVDDLLNPNNYYLRGLTSEGLYGAGQNCENGLSFQFDGGYDGYGDIIMTIEDNGDGPQIIIFSNSEVPENLDVMMQFCFDVNDQQYVYYVHFVTEEAYLNGISEVSTIRSAVAAIYDLQGRLLSNGHKSNSPQKGVYIVNGRKVIKN
jgi:hypothetical protein